MSTQTITDTEAGHMAEGLVKVIQGTKHSPFPATPGPPPLPPGAHSRGA
jgi:hypothetical protein